MVDCINLRREFGSIYRVLYEESYYAERGDHGRIPDPWLMVIPCQSGHICPWGSNLLTYCSNGLGPILNRVRAIPYAVVVQDGSDGANVTFPVEHFDEVAAIVKPKRRRRSMSPEHKAKLMESNKQYRFLPASKSDSSGQGRAQAPLVDDLPVQ